MGNGTWSTESYANASVARAVSKTPDFAYSQSAKSVHLLLQASRIKDKPFGVLESRDSVEHPNSTAIILNFDVTGSNRSRAQIAQKKLPDLMDAITKVLPDPQISVAANDDVFVSYANAFQISEFESDNRIDEWIRNIWLIGHGGSNNGESYDLAMFAAARLTSTDCFEKRGKKGYFFMYADEPIFDQLDKSTVQLVFGQSIQENSIPIASLVQELKAKWDVHVLWPEGGQHDALDQYKVLFGEECVHVLQNPNAICETVVDIISEKESANPSPVSAASAPGVSTFYPRSE